MAREEGTYILLVDVFNGQDTLFFPLFYQKYNEDDFQEDKKHVVITDNTFCNCVPKVVFYTGEQIIVNNNSYRTCGGVKNKD